MRKAHTLGIQVRRELLRKALVVPTFVLLFLGTVFCGCRRSDKALVRCKGIHSSTNAAVEMVCTGAFIHVSLKEGPVIVRGRVPSIPFGPVSLKRVAGLENGLDKWTKSIPPIDRTSLVEVPGTAIWLMIVDGRVAPMIVDGFSHEYWRIEGLGADFENTGRIGPRFGKISCWGVKTDGDITRQWTLDFTDPSGVLVVLYEERW